MTTDCGLVDATISASEKDLPVLRPSNHSSVCSYCGNSPGEESRDVTTFNHQSKSK